jgi:hypothetical protein
VIGFKAAAGRAVVRVLARISASSCSLQHEAAYGTPRLEACDLELWHETRAIQA